MLSKHIFIFVSKAQLMVILFLSIKNNMGVIDK